MDLSKQPKERVETIAQVAVISKERSGHFPGFNGVMIYLPQEELIDLIPEYQGTILQEIEAFTQDFFSYITYYDYTIKFIKKVLVLAKKFDPRDSGPLAEKILKQIISDENKMPYVRKPVYYVATGELGIAIAICIDKRFWTNRW